MLLKYLGSSLMQTSRQRHISISPLIVQNVGSIQQLSNADP